MLIILKKSLYTQNLNFLYGNIFLILFIFLGHEKKYIFLFLDRIILQFGIGLLGLSPPRKFNNQATFSGALIKILSKFFFFKILINLLIFEFILSPAILLFKL